MFSLLRVTFLPLLGMSCRFLSVAKHCKLYVVDGSMFLYPINILKLCSGMYSVIWKNLTPLGLDFKFLGKIRAAFRSKSNFVPFLKQILLSTLPHAQKLCSFPFLS